MGENYEKILELRSRFDTPLLFDAIEALEIKNPLYVFPLGCFVDTDSLNGEIMDTFEFIKKYENDPRELKGRVVVCAVRGKAANDVAPQGKQVGVGFSYKVQKRYELKNTIERMCFGNIKELINLVGYDIYLRLIDAYRQTFISYLPYLDETVNKMLTRLATPVEEKNLIMQARYYLKQVQVKKFLNILWRLGLAKAMLNRKNGRTYWQLTKPIDKINSNDIINQLSEIIG